MGRKLNDPKKLSGGSQISSEAEVDVCVLFIVIVNNLLCCVLIGD